jgi:hypothetical protein
VPTAALISSKSLKTRMGDAPPSDVELRTRPADPGVGIFRTDATDHRG